MIQFRLLTPGDTFQWAFPRLPALRTPDDHSHEAAAPARWYADIDFTENWRREINRLILTDCAMGAFRSTTCLAIAAATPLQQLYWWSLCECVVHTPYRRNGIGTRLLQHLEKHLAETMGARVLLGTARHGDAAAQAFLTHNAYLIAGNEIKHHETVDVWIYRKRLCDHRLSVVPSPAA